VKGKKEKERERERGNLEYKNREKELRK